jgi:DNA-3-methyladenine glycosylase II
MISLQATTANLLEEACTHLIKVEARMEPLVAAHHCHLFSPAGLAEKVDPFESLASSIINQQISGVAAKAIKKRFITLFNECNQMITSMGRLSSGQCFPHPSQVAMIPIERLRAVGLSQRKAEYIVELAEQFASGKLSSQMLANTPYEEILEKLIVIRGLGRWSIEMFACFGLKRIDIFSLGDLGVQRGMAIFMGRDVSQLKNKGGKWKYMTAAEMKIVSDKFRPYRSLFMWYMWRVEQTDIASLNVLYNI